MLFLRSRTGSGASFRDYTADQSHTPHAVMEAALAHAVRNKAEAARARSNLFEKRRALMESWSNTAPLDLSDYCSEGFGLVGCRGQGHTAGGGRVAAGSCPPAAPTESGRAPLGHPAPLIMVAAQRYTL